MRVKVMRMMSGMIGGSGDDRAMLSEGGYVNHRISTRFLFERGVFLSICIIDTRLPSLFFISILHCDSGAVY